MIFKQEAVREIMSCDVVAAMPDDSAEVAVKLMPNRDIGFIPGINKSKSSIHRG